MRSVGSIPPAPLLRPDMTGAMASGETAGARPEAVGWRWPTGADQGAGPGGVWASANDVVAANAAAANRAILVMASSSTKV